MIRLAYVLAAVLWLSPDSARAQVIADPAVPDAVLSLQATALEGSALDSACAARAMPHRAAALLANLRDAIRGGRARTQPPTLSPTAATMRASTITVGWYGALLVMGLFVLVLGGNRLRQVSETLEHDTGRALVTGLVADLASIPLLLLIVIVLAATIVGILLIPFAVVVLMLVYAGLALLGFLAVSSVTGRAVLGRRRARMTERGASLAGLVIGLSLYLALWLAAALFTWSPTAALVLRAVALGVTAMAVTAGVGAVLRSLRGPREDTTTLELTGEHNLAWQTPTPIGGVAAVRRTNPS